MRVGFTFTFFVALAAISRLGSGAPGPPDPGTQLMLDYPDQVRYFPFDEAVQRSKMTGRPIFLLFTNPKCGPCISLHLAILSEPNEAAFINTHYVPVKAMYKLAAVDGVTLSASDRSLQERFHPKGAPTLVLVAPDGRELNALRVGRQAEDQSAPTSCRTRECGTQVGASAP